ncbi:MAG: insulinase family protein [Haliangiales bacterium]
MALTASGCGGAPAANDQAAAIDDPKAAAVPKTTAQIIDSSALPEVQREPLANDALGVTIHRLSNGMTVYLSTDRSAPRVSAWIAVRAGSRHDPPDSTGLAHYLEHMLFKGTDELGTTDAAAEKVHLDRIEALYAELRAAEDDASARAAILAEIDSETQKAAQYAIPNEFDQMYAKMGVNGLNAFTSDEQTVYIADIPANRFAAWAKVEAERFRDPRFRLFYPELEAVYEEKNASLDNPNSQVFESLAKALFPEHAYAQPTIGLAEHLKTPAYGDMVAFFQRWYVPNNMAIVLAGDIDPETALPVLEAEFGAWAPKPLVPPRAGRVAPPAARQQVDVVTTGEAGVYLAWHTAPANHEDQAALSVLDLLMDNAASGLVNTELVLSQKLPQAGSFPTELREAGYWTLYGIARADQSLADVEALLLGVVEKLAAGDFTQADLDAVVLHAEMREMREMESQRARVAKMTEAFILGTPWAVAARRSERLRQVTREDVIAAARRYLGPGYVAVYRQNGAHTPTKIDKPKITPVPIDPSKQSDFAAQILDMPAPPLEPDWIEQGSDYQRQALPAGPFIASKNDISELFLVVYQYDFGSRERELVCLALDLMQQSGTASQSPAELQRALYALGTTIRVQCDADSIQLIVDGVDRHLETSVAMLDGWLRGAALQDDIRAKLVANIISQRKDEMDSPRDIARALTAYGQRGAQSPYLAAPSNRTLLSSKLPALAKLLRGLPDTGHRTVYFGPRAIADAAAVVGLGAKHRPAPVRAPVRYRAVSGTKLYLLDKGVAQANISIAIPNPPTTAKERGISRLYTEYVGGGMGALIFQELREARGLAYRAWGYHSTGARIGDQSGLFGGIGTQSDKTVESLRTMLSLLRELPLQPARLETAKRSLEESYRASRLPPRQVPFAVLSWDDLGLSRDPRPAELEVIRAADLVDLKTFGTKISAGDAIVTVMSDAARVDLDALGKIGSVERVAVKDVFAY